METQKIDLDFNVDHSKFDESNALVLPNKKITKPSTKETKNKVTKKVLLSKKKRKKLEKVLERKSKKLNRAKLITDLQEFQVKEAEYDLMPSTSVMQTAGRKRIYDLLKLYNSINTNDSRKSSETDDTNRRKFKLPKIKLKCNEKNFNRNIKSQKAKQKDLNIVEEEDSSEEDLDQFSSDEESYKSNVDSTNSNSTVNEKVQDASFSINDQVTDEVNKPKPNIASPIKEKTNLGLKDKVMTQEKKETKSSVYVTVDRPEEVQKGRLKLPILAEEHRIMEEIMYNPVVIVCGETGSGKTTQVPQFLYEGGYALNGKMIGVTEPRRVAAISMSKRVAHELNLSSSEVSYQIRFEGNVTDKTRVKFMTDGILLKEIQNDFMLRKYSAIIIDEAHERSLYSDILIGFLSRVVKTRQKQGDPLKLIIMSATLRVEDFTENTKLFKDIPPVIKIDSRQYPVSVHFSKQTNPNYLKEAFKKVCKIHSSNPSGGILVFVTGRQEVNSLCTMLREKFPFKNDKPAANNENGDSNYDDKVAFSETKPQKEALSIHTVNLDLYSAAPMENERLMDDFDYSDDESDKEGLSKLEAEDDEDDMIGAITTEPLYCLPLYSMLPNYKQSLVFKDPPPGCRLCVIATNVAETSLTIPNIKYVIDTGKIKNKVFDNITGISAFVIDWTSKASADQRAGRAGRTSAGHCYRLYSSAVYNDQFGKYAEPEILVKPIDDLILQMKSIGIDNVANFPFPSCPKIESLLIAEKRLVLLQALKEETFTVKHNKKITRSSITPLGRIMSTFPVNPRYSKMLCLSTQSDLLPFTIAIISALTVQEIFLPTENVSHQFRSRKNVFFSNPNCYILGDLMTILSAVGAANFEGLSGKFCEHYGLRYNAMLEINKLRMQLTQQVKEISKNTNVSFDLAPPDDDQVKLLRQLFLCAFADHVAKRVPLTYMNEEDSTAKAKRAGIQNCYQSIEVEVPVQISPHSVLHSKSPQYVVYHDMFESSRMYMRNVVAIEPEWLPIYAPNRCTFSNPLTEPAPRYDGKQDKVKCHRACTFGPHAWPLPAVELDYPECNEKYQYFAYFLFNGDIMKYFSRNINFLITPAIVFTKTWAFVQPKVEKVISSLISNQISSKKALLSKWKSDRAFLLNEYLEWIHESQKDKIRSLWPPTN